MPKVSERIRCRGTTVVETAIVLSLLILPLTLAIFQYGWLFLKAQQITNAARQGARVGICADSTEVYAEIDRVMALAGMAGSGYHKNVEPDPNSLSAGDPLTADVNVPSANIALINIPLLPKPAYIGASVTMAKEGP